MANFRAPNRRFVRESRPLDFIYDPVFTMPSKVNFYKSANMASRVGDSKMRLRTNYPTMFSDIMMDRRVEACLQSSSPSYMDKFMPRYDISGTPVVPSGDGLPYRNMDDVTGAQRAKYFIRYMNPMENLQSYHFTRQIKTRKHSRERALQEPFKTRGTQTDQREMETQTDPYSPQYVLPHPEDYPKVLALVKMTWGKGLPATLDDIVTIERALTRRLLEINDLRQTANFAFEKRIKLMEELEAQKWKEREKEFEKIKNIKLEIVTKQLQELKVKMSHDQTSRLEKLFDLRSKDNAKRLYQIKMQYLRQLRKLERKHYLGKKTFKRDIILEYIDMESSIYAPVVRNGPNIDQLTSAPDYQFTVHRDYETLTYLTEMESFANEHLNFNLKKFSEDVQKIKPNRATQIAEKQLQDCFETFNDVCKQKAEALEDEMLNSMIMKSVRRLSTPENDLVCEEDDDDEEAVVLLQTLIRGRAVQNMLRQEAENSMETILQMKEVYETDPYGALQPLAEKVALRQQQYERDVALGQENEVKELMEQVEGEVLSHMMTFLEKEMTRLLDERKIHTLILLAERERRMLEASEAGKRQREEECQRTNDEIWRQVVGVHQQTVDMYLEDIYLESINRASDDEGRKYVQELAKTVNEAAYAMERNIKEYDKDEIAADLVHSFLFPQVRRENVQRQVADLHGRYYNVATQVTNAVLNSKGVVHEVLSTIGDELKNRFDIGASTVGASYSAVEQIIHEAVKKVMEKEFGPDVFKTQKGEKIADNEAGGDGKKRSKRRKDKEGKGQQERGSVTDGNLISSASVPPVGLDSSSLDKSVDMSLKGKESSTKILSIVSIEKLSQSENEVPKEKDPNIIIASDSSYAITVKGASVSVDIVSGTTTSTPAVSEKGVQKEVQETPGDEIVVQDEEDDLSDDDGRNAWEIPIELPPGLSELVGLKSMEVEAVDQVGVEMAELGESAVKVYDAARAAVDAIMGQLELNLIASDDDSDVELDDQDDED